MSNEYFPHDYGARLSLRAVRKDFGLEGLGFYWCFVEILHEEGGYIKENDIENIAYDLQVKPELCDSIIRNYDLFVIKKGKIYSERVLKNIKKRAEISEARKSAANARWQPEPEEPSSPPKKEINNEETDEEYIEALEAQKEIIFKSFDDWEAESDNFIFSEANGPRQLIENLFNEISDKKTLKINNRNIDTFDFIVSLRYFFKSGNTKNQLLNLIEEVDTKKRNGEVKNKQNYLISTLYNTAKMGEF